MSFRRVIFASKGEVFGHWGTDWQYMWDELKEPPNVTSKGIQVLLKVSYLCNRNMYTTETSNDLMIDFTVGIVHCVQVC